MFKKILPYFSLFTSAGTLVCCALPSLFVVLGAGAVFAGVVADFPFLIWMSEHKVVIFVLAGILLLLAGAALWSSRNDPCPIDPELANACKKTRKFSVITYFVSLTLFAVGGLFAYILPLFLESSQ